ncbi:probable beta-hexosaminidase fdl [Sitophilus oryzae]|uniref:Beta-hexosaminidase n=1 Tax=Sitophilus oryzae TaxID=7048 RepID=A0A6J2XQB2_SITOR|nr:probable beta-hexosaminidase fdl [Sitophilus oryzae]
MKLISMAMSNVSRLFLLMSLGFLLECSFIGIRNVHATGPQYSADNWVCRNETGCTQLGEDVQHQNGEKIMSNETCYMLCPKEPSLWPKPIFVEVQDKNFSAFQKQHIFLKVLSPTNKTRKMAERAANLFINNLTGSSKYNRIFEEETEEVVKIHVHIKNNDTKLTSSTNESYILTVGYQKNEVRVKITAPTYFGVRHGLETLSQLIWYDAQTDRLRIMHEIRIIDEPKFPHRGIMIDVARNFIPIWYLKRVIDGMAINKLNVLHLHASDSESFPLVLPNNPDFAKNGAYDKAMTYSTRDTKDLIAYANIRGVRVILEVDAPSHVTPNAWPNGQTMCGKESVFRATLNPDDSNVFGTLQSVYRDLLSLGSDGDSFHIGGDEVVLDCWKQSKSGKTLSDLYYLWVNFTNQMVEQLKSANGGNLTSDVILWSSPLTDRFITYLKNKPNLVVQYWFGKFDHIFQNNLRIIFSTVGYWYLDCGYGPWKKNQVLGACDPYTHWMKVYRYRPWEQYVNRLNQVMGGEVCLWTEQVAAEDVETRIWPRAAAFAERIWSDPGWEDRERNRLYARFNRHIIRMRRRGISVAAIWPIYCSYYPDKC